MYINAREVGDYDFAQEILLVVVDSKLFLCIASRKSTLSQFLFTKHQPRCEEQLADSATAHFVHSFSWPCVKICLLAGGFIDVVEKVTSQPFWQNLKSIS